MTTASDFKSRFINILAISTPEVAEAMKEVIVLLIARGTPPLSPNVAPDYLTVTKVWTEERPPRTGPEIFLELLCFPSNLDLPGPLEALPPIPAVFDVEGVAKAAAAIMWLRDRGVDFSMKPSGDDRWKFIATPSDGTAAETIVKSICEMLERGDEQVTLRIEAKEDKEKVHVIRIRKNSEAMM